MGHIVEGYQITLYTVESRRHRGKQLSHWLMEVMRDLKLQGATHRWRPGHRAPSPAAQLALRRTDRPAGADHADRHRGGGRCPVRAACRGAGGDLLYAFSGGVRPRRRRGARALSRASPGWQARPRAGTGPPCSDFAASSASSACARCTAGRALEALGEAPTAGERGISNADPAERAAPQHVRRSEAFAEQRGDAAIAVRSRRPRPHSCRRATCWPGPLRAASRDRPWPVRNRSRRTPSSAGRRRAAESPARATGRSA